MSGLEDDDFEGILCIKTIITVIEKIFLMVCFVYKHTRLNPHHIWYRCM